MSAPCWAYTRLAHFWPGAGNLDKTRCAFWRHEIQYTACKWISIRTVTWLILRVSLPVHTCNKNVLITIEKIYNKLNLQPMLWCRYFSFFLIKSVMYVSNNKELASFLNFFGVPCRLCQWNGYNAFSHFKCLRGQNNSSSRATVRVERRLAYTAPLLIHHEHHILVEGWTHSEF